MKWRTVKLPGDALEDKAKVVDCRRLCLISAIALLVTYLRSNGVAGCDKPLTDCENERLFMFGRDCGLGTPGGPHPGPVKQCQKHSDQLFSHPSNPESCKAGVL